MRFSVIIPIFNRAGTIQKCIDSVLHQDFEDYEVLVVDDGSTDATWEVLQKYRTDFSHLRVFHQTNAGVSSARNRGLEHAQGEFVIFLDSDDWVEQGYLQALDSMLDSDDVDGVILDYFVDSFNDSPVKANSNVFLPNEISAPEYQEFFLNGAINNCMWDKVIRRDVFQTGNVVFPQSLSICEDAVVAASIGNHVKKIKVTDSAFLHYVQNEGSLSRKLTTISTVRQIFEALCLIENVFRTAGQSTSRINEMKLRQLFYYVVTLERDFSNERKQVLKTFFSIVDSLRFADCRTTRSKVYLIFSRLSKIRPIRAILFSAYNFAKNRASN